MKRSGAIAFLGPSLPAAEAQRLLPRVQVWGPARQGDVLRALRKRPRVILLIDGVFESQPSVWHQELLIALAEGVTMFGASSMGALRAVELAPFGMIGVGAVFRGYAEGRFTDDADVALLHASAEHAHRPLTVPLVNVVAVAELAYESQVLSRKEARALISAAREVHYQDRGWPQILKCVPWAPSRRDAFDAFRREHPCDIKADDARECLRAARDFLKRGADRAAVRNEVLSVWARRAWVAQQGEPPRVDAADGLRTLLLAEWGRSLGLQPDPARVKHFEKRAASLGLDAGLVRRQAEALALEELMLRRPGMLLAQAPSVDEARWLEAVRGLKG